MNRINNALNSIDWCKINGQMQNCSNIPKDIMNLMSENMSVRQKAYWNLDNHIVVQGTLFEGAFYIIPFLLHYINDKNNCGKTEFYELLYEIANGWSDEKICYETVGIDDFIFYKPCNFFVESVDLDIACKKAVEKGWDIFKSELFDISSDYRKNALEIMFLFEENWLELSEYLQKIICTENGDFILVAKEYLGEIDTIT